MKQQAEFKTNKLKQGKQQQTILNFLKKHHGKCIWTGIDKEEQNYSTLTAKQY